MTDTSKHANALTPMPATSGAPGDDAGEWAAARRLMRDYVRNYRRYIVMAVLCMFVIAGATVASMWLLKPAMDRLIIEGERSLLLVIPAAIVGVFIIKAVAMIAQGRLMGYVGLRIVSDLQKQLFSHVIHSDLSRLNDTHSGRFAASFLSDTQLVRNSVTSGITNVFKDGSTAVALLLFVYWQHWVLAFLATVVLPLIATMVRRLGKRTRKASKKSMAETGTMSTLISESLDGIRVVKAYGQETREIDRLNASVERRLYHQLKAAYAGAAASPLTELLTGFGLAAVIYYGALEALSGRLSPGEFLSIMASIMAAYQPLRALARMRTVLAEGLAAAERIFEVIDVAPEITDRPDAPKLDVTKGTVALDDVTFLYRDGTKALDGVSLTAPSGQFVALVGPSGAGKSTILNLIPRFYDVDKGSVAIDGQDIRTVSMESLRNAISIVTQEPFLFDDTVRANIAYARPDASKEDIEAAARDAAAHDFILSLPKGYDTIVGEQGVKLSGGQRQRLAIARALLADAPILLLDEATSALDTESERQVQIAINRLMKGRTTIVIAHRLSTVLNADCIYVLDKGRVVESGSHAELLKAGGLYARLYNTQANDDTAQTAPLAAGEG